MENYVDRRLWILFNKMTEDDQYEFTVSHCQDCDLMFLNPRLTHEEILRKYSFLNEINSTNSEYSRNPIKRKDARAKRFYDLINEVMSANNIKYDNPRLLDIGGQYGYNLKYFNEFDRHICDFEEHEYESEIKYMGPDLEKIEGKFEVIFSNHTVEHLSEFQQFFTSATNLLSDDGIFYVEVPLGAFREVYNLKEPITHFNFFSEKSLYNLFKEFGLEVLHLSTKFQWLMIGGEWCLNIIGAKDKSKKGITRTLVTSSEIKFRTTYYLPMIVNKFTRKF